MSRDHDSHIVPLVVSTPVGAVTTFSATSSLQSLSLLVPPPVNPTITATTHPRLWVTQADLPALQAKAVSSNPLFAAVQARALAAQTLFTTTFPAGSWQNADCGAGPFHIEEEAAALAFMSLTQSGLAAAPWANLAHDLLMFVFNHVATNAIRVNPTPRPSAIPLPPVALNVVPPPIAADATTWFASYEFPTGNAGRDSAFLFFLAVDWVYGTFSSAEKQTIQQVMRFWAYHNTNTGGVDVPAPYGAMSNDPAGAAALVSTHDRLRNVAFNGRNRRYALMAGLSLVLDTADDPIVDAALPAETLGNTTQSYRNDVALAWNWQNDYFFNNDGAGGIPLEGWEYGRVSFGLQQAGVLSQLSAGFAPAAPAPPTVDTYQAHRQFLTHPWWDTFIDGFRHTLSPAKVNFQGYASPMYTIANIAQATRLFAFRDFVTVLGPLAVTAQRNAVVGTDPTAPARLAKLKWLMRDALEYGGADFRNRLTDVPHLFYLYMVFSDADVLSTASWPDPWASAPTTFAAQALNGATAPTGVFCRTLARSDWSATASWFSFYSSYISISHQMPYNGMFEFWRKGEWLTKQRAGYFQGFGDGAESQNILGVKNTLDNGLTDASDPNYSTAWEFAAFQQGGQFFFSAGDPSTKTSADPSAGYVFAESDTTNLYNRVLAIRPSAAASDVKHVSRSVFWIRPDWVVVYDRASTGAAGGPNVKWKQFNLNLTVPTTSVTTTAPNQKTASLPSGQKLVISALLPAAPTLTVAGLDPDLTAELVPFGRPGPTSPRFPNGYQSTMETVQSGFRSTDATNPQVARFLHVLQGVDAGVQADSPTATQSASGARFDGAIVGRFAAFFSRDLTQTVAAVTFSPLPISVATCYVSGLAPGGAYNVAISSPSATTWAIAVTTGVGSTADAAGVLTIANPTPQPAPQPVPVPPVVSPPVAPPLPPPPPPPPPVVVPPPAVGAPPPPPPSTTATLPMTVGIYQHTATLLGDGTVLVACGNKDAGLNDRKSAIRFDRASSAWIKVPENPPTSVPVLPSRAEHTATLLANGRVLLVGASPFHVLYDPTGPSAWPWVVAGATTTVRFGHAAVRVADGRVLVVGGCSLQTQAPAYATATIFGSAEIYTPSNNGWVACAPMADARRYCTATLLPNGTVLVVGGESATSTTLATAQIYDPVLNVWSATSNVMNSARARHTATLLPDGTVLIAGGTNAGAAVSTADIYDPTTRQFAAAGAVGSMADARSAHGAVLLANGLVLVTGGVGIAAVLSSAETYDPAAKRWTKLAASMASPRANHTLTLLTTGEVLAVGGRAVTTGGGIASAELIHS